MISPAGFVPRQLRAGPVLLDLIYRDAHLHEAWLRLHPREFGLLWRLAETPRTILCRATLLRDVWRVYHDPPTNTLEVHVFRLRRKLAAFGIDRLVLTDPHGGYLLDADVHPVVPADGLREALDSYLRMGNGAAQEPQPG